MEYNGQIDFYLVEWTKDITFSLSGEALEDVSALTAVWRNVGTVHLVSLSKFH